MPDPWFYWKTGVHFKEADYTLTADVLDVDAFWKPIAERLLVLHLVLPLHHRYDWSLYGKNVYSYWWDFFLDEKVYYSADCRPGKGDVGMCIYATPGGKTRLRVACRNHLAMKVYTSLLEILADEFGVNTAGGGEAEGPANGKAVSEKVIAQRKAWHNRRVTIWRAIERDARAGETGRYIYEHMRTNKDGSKACSYETLLDIIRAGIKGELDEMID